MAHYAFLDENYIVTEVITGKDEGNFDWEIQYGSFRGQLCKRTSYNTYGGVYYEPGTNTPSPDQSKAFRKNYAGIGYTYDPQRDAFIPPKPYPSWILNDFSCLWEAPVAMPEDAGTGEPPKSYAWNEQTLFWNEIIQE
jgi:hypothetical protein